MSNIGIARSQVTTKGGSGSGAGGNWLDVKTFGAVGNGVILEQLSITSGTPNLTSASPSFAVTDVGKVIMVTGAGPNGTDLWTTVAAFVNSSAVTLAANASTTVNPASTVIQPYLGLLGGTDDTAAIQACINAAGAAALGVYISPGVYIYSAVLTMPTVPPPFIFGEADRTWLVAQNPSIAAYSGLLNSSVLPYNVSIYQFNVLGGSWNRTLAPTPGTEIFWETTSADISKISVYNTIFLSGLSIHAIIGTISGNFDVGQSNYQLDPCYVSTCEASSFMLGGQGEGGTAVDCLATGDWPVEYGFDHTPATDLSVTLINCNAVPGTFIKTIPRGFNIASGVAAYNCVAEGCPIGFLISTGGTVRDCTTAFPSEIAAFLVSNGLMPYIATQATQYFLNDVIQDTNGNYQKVTTPGTTAGIDNPTGSTVLENTTIDGTVTWTMVTFSPGTVTSALIDHCFDTTGSFYSLYDLGTRTTLNQNRFTATVVTTNPAEVVVSGVQTVSANYMTALGDDMILVNSTSATTITLITTNQIPGKSQTVKNISTGTVRGV